EAIFTITLHLGAFGKTRESRRRRSHEARHLASGRQELCWKLPTSMFIPTEDRILLPRTQLDSNPPAACWSLSAGMMPTSRGGIHRTGPVPADPVSIDPNYLDDSQDLKDLIAGLSLAREIGNSSALRPFTGREVAPGPISVWNWSNSFGMGWLRT